MPLQLFVAALSAAFGLVSVAVALSLWSRIRAWCEDSLFPWFEKNLPQIAPHVRSAFAAVDNLVIAARRLAWHRLREHLLHQVLTLERLSTSTWMRQVVSWVLKILRTGQAVPVQIVAEGECQLERQRRLRPQVAARLKALKVPNSKSRKTDNRQAAGFSAGPASAFFLPLAVFRPFLGSGA